MSQFPMKKKKRLHPSEAKPSFSPKYTVIFPDLVLGLVEKRMGRSRKAFLTKLALSKGFCVEDIGSEKVTHVISERNSGDEVVEWLRRYGRCCAGTPGNSPALLDISWLTESMDARHPVEIEPRHRLKVTPHAEPLAAKCQVAQYACQRRTPLAHSNKNLTEALEVMAKEAEFRGSAGRSLAFSRAASVLKSLPWTVQSVQQLMSMPCIGEHSRRIIQEVLEDGQSPEVEDVKQSERFQTMKLFTNIFGVGVKTASQWYQEGLRTLADLRARSASLTKEQQAGLLHFDDLNTPVERSDADVIAQVVQEAVERCLPGASVTLTGGFRRGKQCGHDVDLLITHPTEGQEVGLLSKVIGWLESQGYLLYSSCHRRRDHGKEELMSSTSTMDHFERCFSIFCLGCVPKDIQQATGAHMAAKSLRNSGAPGFYKAVRADLVVTPYSEFPFALLGWTGSQNFERELRRFCKREKKMVLNNHALYHQEQVPPDVGLPSSPTSFLGVDLTDKETFLPAASEEEIFQHLGLEYLPPEERNA